MAKRFTATEKWDKKWYMQLSPKLKCLWQYLNDKCDQAGVWDENFIIASAHIGDTICEDDMQAFGERVERLGDDKWWIVSHVKFQCGQLSQKCKAHIPIIKSLKENGLFERVTEGYNKGYVYPLDTLQEKEIEKEKEKEKGGVGEFEMREVDVLGFDEARKQMHAAEMWQETLIMQLGRNFGHQLTFAKMREWIDIFFKDKQGDPDNLRPDVKSYQVWFKNWLKIELKAKGSSRVGNDPVPPYHKRPTR